MGFSSLTKRGSIKNLKDLRLSHSLSFGSKQKAGSHSLPSSPVQDKVSIHQWQASAGGVDSDTMNAPLPWFLRQTKADRNLAFIELEWQQRERLVTGSPVSDVNSQWARTNGLRDTASRNRYYNIEPYASNRIKLKVGEGSNDYINASPIVLGRRRYISTQGPKQNSVAHFYRMLAHETSSVAVVIMLTQTHEAGREKCYNYWPRDENAPALPLLADPDDTEDLFEGSVSLVSTELDDKSQSDVSHLKLRTRNKSKDGGGGGHEPWREKDVWHLHFGAWPDFYVPEGEDRQALLNLLLLSRRLNVGAPDPMSASFPPSLPRTSDGATEASNAEVGGGDELNPRIVHCSAGVGRSGTFIALDYLLARLESGALDDVPDGVDPVAETVDALRRQRMMMVQGESQFHFLYDVLRELWVARWSGKEQS